MSKIVRVTLGIFAALAIAGVLAYVFMGASQNCVGYQIMEVPSPTKAFLATVQSNSCTPSHELQTVVEVTGAPGATGWAFAAPSAVPNGGPHSPTPVTLTWLGDAELQIAYPRGTVNTIARRESIGNVKVVYTELGPQP